MPIQSPAEPEEKSWLSKIPLIGNYLDNTYSGFVDITGDKSKSISQKAESLFVWSVVNSPAIQLGLQSEPVKKSLQSFTATMADSLISIGDADRNPRIAASHNQFWDSMDAWQGVIDMRKQAQDYTWNALKNGSWQEAGQGMSAILKQNTAVAKEAQWFTGVMAWNVVTTPVRIFTHDIPEFLDARQERLQGEDRLWDVLFTSTNLMGDVAGTYDMAKPFGLTESANSWLSTKLLGRDLPVIPPKFIPYYLQDMFKGGNNINLINNLVENTYAAPSQLMQSALRYQNSFSEYQNYLSRMTSLSEQVQSLMPKNKPVQVTDDLIKIHLDAADATPELQNLITRFAEKTGGKFRAWISGQKGHWECS